jgi:rSAM/selenodomain-associated transferase 1
MSRRLIVFGRLPVRGRVKTRLAATVGEARALAAHEALVACAVALGETGDWRREFRHDGGEADEHPLAAALAERGWVVAAQRGVDLGARMHEALAAALAEGDLPVLIGTDCPVLGAGDLEAAFAALEGVDPTGAADATDAVFAPAEDGGYALVGIGRPLPALFEGIDWGTPGVMAATRVRLAACGARARELRTVWDVDVEADLHRWERAVASTAGRRCGDAADPRTS